MSHILSHFSPLQLLIILFSYVNSAFKSCNEQIDPLVDIPQVICSTKKSCSSFLLQSIAVSISRNVHEPVPNDQGIAWLL